MGATNATSNGNKQFFKLKEVEEGETKGEFRFFEQKKTGDKWGDGETFNQLQGIVTDVFTKEYEYNGEKKKQLCVVVQDVADTMEFSLGLRSMAAQAILNTLAGGNGFDLTFTCGKPKGKDGKYYPTLYINKPGNTQEERRTNWKYQISDLPKVTTITDEDGNKIKKGQKASDEFWLEVVDFVKDQLGSKEPRPTYTTEPALSKQKPVVKQEPTMTAKGNSTINPDEDSLPF